MHRTLFSIFGFFGLAIAFPNALTARDLDVNDPTASDPQTPPKTISFPKGADNPFPDGLPTQPDECDGQAPSDDCLNNLSKGKTGGYLYFDKNSECSNSQKSALMTAVWDATSLAYYASNIFLRPYKDERGDASNIFYMGPDYESQSSRIYHNLDRVYNFKTPETSEKQYITVSCKDTEKLCGGVVNGKGVGGYAWTVSGYFYYYHYITLCETFFTLPTLAEKHDQIEKELDDGDTSSAKDMVYLRTTGQYFLHEFMHTRLANSDTQPPIIDEYVEPIPKGESPGTGDIKAYGPRQVHNLARRSVNQGGGVTRASTNADSYAILANAIWWWDTTNYFPGVPGKKNPATAQDDFDDDNFPVGLFLDLGNRTFSETQNLDLASMFRDELPSFGDGSPASDPDYQIPAPPEHSGAPPSPGDPPGR